jgi:hypothetical protein
VNRVPTVSADRNARGTGSVFIAAFILLGVTAAPANAQAPEPVRPAVETLDVRCDVCHDCAAPTAKEPCLRRCARPRDAPKPANGGPAIVVLDELADRYLPVPFDHQGHARMAEMTRGCTVCHHFTPEGQAYPACKTCHEVSSLRADIHKPGLKGAYHRQCLNCHREWSGDTRCEVCHLSKTGRGSKSNGGRTPSTDDIVGRMHPPIAEPETEFFRANSGPLSGTQIIFHHREHIHRFGLKCVECHHEDNCSRCHRGGEPLETRQRTLEEHHQPCFRCHSQADRNPCERCHWSEGTPRLGLFDHASTGWPLSRYHEVKSCRSCHAAVPFVKPQRDCNSCHSGWSSSSFDHRVTGQALDDNHARLDCDACHVERRFDRPPTCDSCHGADEGIVFPNKRPGGVLRGAGS